MDDPMEDIDKHSESGEEEYDENADEDFNPDAANAEAEESSSDDEEPAEKDTAKKGKKSKKRKPEDDDQGVINADLDSGDEATIQERKRKKRRKQDESAAQDEDSGGEGGFIRTRAQRVAEKEERKHRKRARDGAVTIDVEQVWADLSSAPIGRAETLAPPPQPVEGDEDGEGNKENAPEATAGGDLDPNELITIKRRIEFAGEITEIEERHPRSSKEAQKYLAQHPEADPKHASNHDPSGLQKPLKRPSIFEPNPAGNVKGVAPEKLRRHAPTKTEGLMSQKLAEMKKNAQKMSTVQKSQLDWKGFVDKEGLRDELDEYGKSKRGFLAREAFLDRAAGAREQAARDARSRL